MIAQKYTIELYAQKHNLTKQSAINKLHLLKKKGYVHVSGGAHQKRIYTLYTVPTKPTNGFYDIVNKYSPEKLVPAFKHYTYGNYTIEHAIIDGIHINDVRTTDATMHLFRHITNWKRLFTLAKKRNCTQQVLFLYKKARKLLKVKRLPGYYDKY
ncbi:MAG: hypothetical protein ACMXYC_03735 [Candidatus Woesearchaeota archaeon]